MKLRIKVISMNILIISMIMLFSSFIVLKTVDNFNLYTIYQYLLSQGNFSQQYISEYLKSSDNIAETLDVDKIILEDMLKKHVGCNVEITGVNLKEPSLIQKSALEGKKAYLISTKGSNRKFYMCVPLSISGTVIGTVNFEYSLYQADSMKRNLIIMLSIIFVTALIISFILSYIFSYRLIKPLEKLTLVTKEFSKGNFKKIEDIKTKDEIEALTNSFNDMGKNINGIIGKLKDEQEKQKKFMDNVTHEIRTPLTNILGYTDLSNRIKDENQRTRYLSYITEEGNRLLVMVNNLLELSRLNKYELAVLKKETDLKELITQVIELMLNRIRKFGFHIEPDLQDIKAVVDENKIKQVIMNLIDNAIKYSEGDIIEIKLRKEDFIYISIKDNGKGIPKADKENILEPFYRVDKSRSRTLGGSGLGLSICKEIINAHGGNIDIESVEECGTIVTISLHQ